MCATSAGLDLVFIKAKAAELGIPLFIHQPTLQELHRKSGYLQHCSCALSTVGLYHALSICQYQGVPGHCFADMQTAPLAGRVHVAENRKNMWSVKGMVATLAQALSKKHKIAFWGLGISAVRLTTENCRVSIIQHLNPKGSSEPVFGLPSLLRDTPATLDTHSSLLNMKA